MMVTVATSAEDRFAETKISSQHVSGSVHMLTGAGGNIGVSVGEEGILIIDDQFEPLAEKIAKAIGDISKSKMRYVINTHYHGDHVGGKEEHIETNAVEHLGALLGGDNVVRHDGVVHVRPWTRGQVGLAREFTYQIRYVHGMAPCM